MSGAPRIVVVCEGSHVIGYYALASGTVKLPEAPGRFRCNIPDPIPVAVLGRLAVDRAYQGKGFGRALVRDMGLRLLNAAEIFGIPWRAPAFSVRANDADDRTRKPQ
ncbi:GNAT family N-acetyltransferase [Rhizobium sp. Root1212]|uniref:GNAT family N-acetyltransferase n=1 Tax=unclassified Rhizobium TaxID=2613769 RepID=UPI003298318A